MNTLYSVLVSIDVLLAIAIIGLILIQHGKGADVGAAFGSGSSGTVFGSQGSASFLTRATAILATLFFVNSLALAYLASNRPEAESVINSVEQTEITAPATDASDVNSMSATESDTDDVPSVESMTSDIPEMADEAMDMDASEMNEADVPDMPADVETQTEAVMNKSIDDVQDGMNSVKEGVETMVDKVTPDDVPE